MCNNDFQSYEIKRTIRPLQRQPENRDKNNRVTKKQEFELQRKVGCHTAKEKNEEQLNCG